MSAASSDAFSQLQAQWRNPGDILSLLLLVGGDVIQKALAQFVGYHIHLDKDRRLSISVAPVAFSFGWVSYAFSSLLVAFGENKLMPSPDYQAVVVNCENGYIRENRSWVLGRVLRDYELAHEVDVNRTALRIDIFRASAPTGCRVDRKWVVGWVTILVQNLLAIVPWIINANWTIFLVTATGTLFSLVTSALPQWRIEKWSRQISPNKRKTVALTQGNGSHHVMIIISEGVGWDLEAMASNASTANFGTKWFVAALGIGWIMLLITVSGIQEHTWYLIGIGGLGMLQNIYAAGSSRSADTFNIPLSQGSDHSSIEALSRSQLSVKETEDTGSDEVDVPGTDVPYPRPLVGVSGALMALEHQLPGIGIKLLPIFFPSQSSFDDKGFWYKREQRFWKAAFQKNNDPIVNEGTLPQPNASKTI